MVTPIQYSVKMIKEEEKIDQALILLYIILQELRDQMLAVKSKKKGKNLLS